MTNEAQKIIDKNGGPAFPTHGFVIVAGQMVPTSDGGQSLRDYFAGQALAGMLANDRTFCTDTDSISGGWQEIAKVAYNGADAMIAARVGKEENHHE